MSITQIHTPQTITDTLVVPIAADADDTRRAAHRLDLAGPAIAAARALGLSDRITILPGGFTWHPDGGHASVHARVEVRVEPGAEDGSLLSISTHFTPSDVALRARLLDAWPVVKPLADALVRRAARSVKAYAEEDRFEAGNEIASTAMAA